LTEALGARGIHFGFPSRPLFRDFSFELAQGDFAGIIGPNGAGKTSLLNLLSGSTKPQRGRVLLFGEDMKRLAARQRAKLMAVVPQESHVLFPFSVLEVVLMGRFPHLGILGMESAGDERQALRCLEEVGLEEAAGRLLHTLSSGERQRVFLARALAQEPRILLLDEPTTFLDLKHRLRIYEILSRLNRSQKLTILTISHDLNLAARYCHRLWLLQDGEVLACGPPAEVLTRERIGQAYGADVEVAKDPRSGAPFIIPYPMQEAGGAS
jgi:iron complex transport system ATP-binding protein